MSKEDAKKEYVALLKKKLEAAKSLDPSVEQRLSDLEG
jgi:hypothetical protein